RASAAPTPRRPSAFPRARFRAAWLVGGGCSATDSPAAGSRRPPCWRRAYPRTWRPRRRGMRRPFFPAPPGRARPRSCPSRTGGWGRRAGARGGPAWGGGRARPPPRGGPGPRPRRPPPPRPAAHPAEARPPTPLPPGEPKVVATIFGDEAITREQFAEHLIRK